MEKNEEINVRLEEILQHIENIESKHAIGTCTTGK